MERKKILLSLLLPLLSALPATAGFPVPTQQVKLAYGQDAVTVIFEADSPITKAKALCDCTSLRTQGKRLIAEVDTSKFDKSVEKQLLATTADGKETRLTMAFVVPEAIIFSTRSLIWKQGREPTPQTLRITLPKGSPVQDVTEASLTGDDFDYLPKKARNGREFSVEVTPRSTARRALNRLIIKTDSPDPRYARHIIYLQVKK